MNGGTRNCAISQPLTSPGTKVTITPARMPHSIASKGGRPSDIEREIGGMGRDHRGQAHHEAEREIDAGRDDDEGLAEREQQRRGREDADRLQIVDVENEARAIGDPRPDLEEHDQDDEEQPSAQLRDPHQQGDAGVALGRLWGHWLFQIGERRGFTRNRPPSERRAAGLVVQIGGRHELL